MTGGTLGRAFIVMPFGHKSAPDGTVIDFDEVFEKLLKPAVEKAGLSAYRADSEQRGGSIHSDMLQGLLLSEFVVADLTLDNPNVWYEIGVRHALRASGAVLTYALRDLLPFDLAGQRMVRYTLAGGQVDPARIAKERATLTEAITATLGDWRGRKASPVYAQLPNLKEPDWKSLKVGDVNEFWQELEYWQSRMRVAQAKQRPGDILLLADETPNRLLEFEALRTAAKALLDLGRPAYALSTIERARKFDPDDIKCRQIEAMALGRLRRFEEAREVLRRLAEERRDGETLGLLARTWKDDWTRQWEAHPLHATDAVAAASATAASLARAAEAYFDAFRSDPADYYPGINALTLGRLWEHLTGHSSKLDLGLVTAGVRWAVHCVIARKKDYWALVSRAELAMAEGHRVPALDDYAEAAESAVGDRVRFALDSSAQTLRFQQTLKYRPDIVAAALAIIEEAERRLDDLIGARPMQAKEPAQVVLFSGHMVDKADRPKPRFPESKADSAAKRMGQELDALKVRPGDLGISQAASGGDLLFADACLARGIRLEIYLPLREPEFLRASVSFAAPHWQQKYDSLKGRPDVVFRIMPDELGLPPDCTDVYDRANRWLLYSALSCGLRKLSFITLWDGNPGDGPGGTDHMVSLVRQLTGRQPAIIDPKTL